MNNSDFEKLVESNGIEDLKRIFNLFVGVNKNKKDMLWQYRMRWKKFIMAKGEVYFNDEELDKKGFDGIQVFIDFRVSSQKVVELVFAELKSQD